MTAQKKNKKAKRKRRIFRRLLSLGISFIFLLLVITSAYIGRGIVNDKYGEFPAYTELKKIEQAQATEVFTRDGKLMGRYFFENRNSIAFNEIPGEIIHALIATEDTRFYEHKGIDVKSLFRVLFKTILMGDRSAGGGSTITQQLAKNLYPRKGSAVDAVIDTKIREIICKPRDW